MVTISIQGVIFDHDGTLVDSESIHCQCWNETISEFLPKKSPHNTNKNLFLNNKHSLENKRHNSLNFPHLSFAEYCLLYNGLPTITTAERIAEQFQLNTAISTLYNNKTHRLNNKLANQPFALLPHTLEILDYLREHKMPMAIASGANREEVENSIKAHKLEKYFQAIVTKQDVAKSKPAPDAYLLAAKHLAIKPDQCLAIEDSDTGYNSAIAAGMHCWRLTPEPLKPLEFINLKSIHHHLTKIL